MRSTKKSLIIKKSTLPGAGLGLFTKIAFRKGDRIVEYKGRRQPWKEVMHEDGYNGYLLRLNRTTAINAFPYKKSPGRFANDASGLARTPGLGNNAEYLIYANRCFIEATCAIYKGEEILVNYGKAFWDLQRKIRSGKDLRRKPKGF